jgi:hypothetical protein
VSSVTESKQFSTVAAGNFPFGLKGGKYSVVTKSTGAGSIFTANYLSCTSVPS